MNGSAPGGADVLTGLFLLGLTCVAGLVVLGTSIWVCFDATKIGLQKTGEKPETGKFHVDMGPVGWMVCCLLLWIVAFPAYIIKRPGFVRRFMPSRPVPTPAGASPPPAPDFEQELMKLARLKESGVVTEAEFNQKKKEILGL
jgi:hypothetical protein